MPIPAKIKMVECVNRIATVDCDIINGAGLGIKKGSKVKIVKYGRGLTVESFSCPICGQFTRIRNVKKSKLTLLTKESEDN